MTRGSRIGPRRCCPAPFAKFKQGKERRPVLCTSWQEKGEQNFPLFYKDMRGIHARQNRMCPRQAKVELLEHAYLR